MRSTLAVAGSLLLLLSIPSFGGTGGGNSPAAVTPGAPAVAAAGPVVSPAPAPSVPPQSPPPPAVPAQGAVPSLLPAASAAPSASFVVPPSEKAPDRVLSPGEVEMQVTKNLEDVPESDEEDGLGEEFFTTASREVEKGEDGVFSGITSPIEKFIRYFQTRGRKKFELYLSRSGKYVGMMQKILVRYGLPEDLVYVALIESGFSPKAYSVAKAAGPWQFISGTGRRYGLRIDWWADERRDAEKSTHAAASYLRDLYGMFESWPLAAAAYNAGEGKIQKAVTRYKSEDFSELIRHRYLKQETKDYVPKMLAALTIAKDPVKYGFGDVAYEAPLDLRTVTVPGGTDLEVVARLLEVPVETIHDWNPELRRFCTPPNRERYDLRLSAEAAQLAEERMEEIRTQGKITFLQHNVRRGETLRDLAGRYKTTVPILMELNGLKRDSLRRTARLVIPVTGLMETEAVPGTEVSPDQLTMAHMRVEEGSRRSRIRGGGRPEAGEAVTVRKGDTLARLAKRHRVRVKELASANGLKPKSKLKAGSRLVLPERAAGARRDSRKRPTRYKVHRGDTLDQIARVYGVPVNRLADRNRLKKDQPLRVGLVLVIPLES
ncbi:MAG TPA: LysM peptidoglycan-binding domain-containing protein [Candidatus Deferrimicrobium sp.]|nr:LysM peptidoglycan-binding domain-containing protein [Candidatus Deferrimicrobium sp.]